MYYKKALEEIECVMDQMNNVLSEDHDGLGCY